MAETLTILRLEVPPTLARTLHSTNPIVIWGPQRRVLDVDHEGAGSWVLRAGRGYLPLSITRIAGGTVIVQRVLSPASSLESWTVLGDGDLPVAPVERYLAYLADVERSPNTVRAYAHDLKDWFTSLAGRGLDWQAVRLGDAGEFGAWLRLPPAGGTGGSRCCRRRAIIWAPRR